MAGDALAQGDSTSYGGDFGVGCVARLAQRIA
jgi:hypothetical protein